MSIDLLTCRAGLAQAQHAFSVERWRPAALHTLARSALPAPCWSEAKATTRKARKCKRNPSVRSQQCCRDVVVTADDGLLLMSTRESLTAQLTKSHKPDEEPAFDLATEEDHTSDEFEGRRKPHKRGSVAPTRARHADSHHWLQASTQHVAGEPQETSKEGIRRAEQSSPRGFSSLAPHKHTTCSKKGQSLVSGGFRNVRGHTGGLSCFRSPEMVGGFRHFRGRTGGLSCFRPPRRAAVILSFDYV